MIRDLGRVLAVLWLPVVLLFGLISGLGVLITRVWSGHWPLTEEDRINRELEADRTPELDRVSNAVSDIANTEMIIATMFVLAFVFRWTFKRWLESVFLVTVVSIQALIFFLTTLVIDRRRPDVPKLDDSPPTSSFPSGHTGAASALYLATAAVLVWHTRQIWLKWLVALLLLAIPLLVGSARLYRGMHHPSDALVAVLNGFLCVLIGYFCIIRPARRSSGYTGFRLKESK